MVNSWKRYRLGEIAEWSSGGTPSKSEEKYWSGHIPWISESSMNGNRYRDSKHKVTELGLNSGTRLAVKDSILILVRGSILHQKIQV
ncbi:restriction endonuclease subunit S [bacterium]|nr:restriction endonuclease subunit S [bacterium]